NKLWKCFVQRYARSIKIEAARYAPRPSFPLQTTIDAPVCHHKITASRQILHDFSVSTHAPTGNAGFGPFDLREQLPGVAKVKGRRQPVACGGRSLARWF